MRVTILLVVLTVVSSWCFAQDELQRWDAGALLAIFDLRSPVGEKTLGIGLRVGYNFNTWGTVESEYNWYPHNTQGNFGQRQFLCGLKAGLRSDRYGGFVKVRPGLVHLGGSSFRIYHGRSETQPALDIGFVLERYASANLSFRVDFGDTMVVFGDKTIRTALDTRKPGLAHCPQFNLGVTVRF